MMGGGKSLRQGRAQFAPPGWAGTNPGAASAPRNLGARWTQMTVARITLVRTAVTPLRFVRRGASEEWGAGSLGVFPETIWMIGSIADYDGPVCGFFGVGVFPKLGLISR